MHSKVPKSQLVTQFSNVFFTCYSTQIPPCLNGSIHFLHFLLMFAFFILMTKPFVLFLKVKFNQTSYVHLHELCPMHETCAFSTKHGYIKVPITKCPLHYIEIHLGIIHCEALEIDIFYFAFFLTSLVKENHMKICESTSSNCMLHIAIVNTLQYDVINMITHGNPTLNTFDVIKHDPHIFKVSS